MDLSATHVRSFDTVWSFLEASPIEALLVDAEERVVRVSRAAERLLGRAAALMTGRPLVEILPGGLGPSVSWLARTSDGVAVRAHASPLESGHVVYLQDRSLEERFETEWRAAFDALDSVVVVLDGDLRILRANRLSRGLGAVEGTALAELASEPLWRKATALVLEAGNEGKSTLISDEAGRTWELAVIVPPGQQIRVLIGADVSRVVKLQEAIHKNESMSAMVALVAGVAHEVRNPLFSISSTLDALEAKFGERGEQRQFVEMLRKSVDRLARLTRDLLQFGKPVEHELESATLHNVVRQARLACEPLADQAGVKLVEELRPHVPANIDGARLVQVLVNLIENAIQHSPRGTAVIVRGADAPVQRGRTAAVICTVEDSGEGLRPDDVPAIFQPFVSRRRGGIGMGLAIAHQIVRRHGGSLEAGNRSSGGAIFTVRLPAAGPERP